MTSTSELIAIGRRTTSLNYFPQPLVLDNGSGARVWDTDGNEYLDFLAGIAVCTLGHAHPALVTAITRQAQLLIHVSNAYFTQPQVELQQKLVSLSFADRVFFANCGATANEAAIKLVRRWQRVVQGTPRFEIITFNGSFHGRTYGALSATAQPKYHAGFEPMVPGFVYATYNDLESVRARVGPHTAAVMLELVQGEGGVVKADQAFVQGVRALCDEHGLALVVDEVQTGVGRTGRWFAYEHFGIVPDVVTLAKGLAGGVPIGAMLSSERLAAGFGRGSHATTFGGNPLATAAALAVLGEIERADLLKRATVVGDALRTGLAGLVASGHAVEVRGMGSLVGVALGCDVETATRVVNRARELGVLVNTAGGNVIRLAPPLTVEEHEIELAVMRVSQAVRDVVAV